MKSNFLLGMLAVMGTAAYATEEPGDFPPPPGWAATAKFHEPDDALGATKSYPQPKVAAGGPALNARRQPQGALTGRIIYLGAGHGWAVVGSEWDTGRGITNGMVEDEGTVDQMSIFARYAWNAGATVAAMRPVGWQSNEVVVDQDDNAAAPGTRVVYTGTWTLSAGTPYYSKAPDTAGDNYRVCVPSTTETGTARYIPNIIVAGEYPVYTWVLPGSNRINQLYRVHHAGGTTEVRVNHKRVGKGWVWLGSYTFNVGDAGYVEISNMKEAGDTGVATIADAIRFGNGMGSVGSAGISGFPREEEAMRYWAQVSVGTPATTSVYDGGGDDVSDNVSVTPKWAAFMNNEAEGPSTERVMLSFHSNAGGGRGALGLYNDPANFPDQYTPNQLRLAELVGRETNEDMRQLDTVLFPAYGSWQDRTTHTYSQTFAFGEIRDDTINGEMDATINEVAFHDDATDALYLKDALARRMIARATVEGLIRYFNQFSGSPLAFPPDEPENLRALNATDGSNDVMLTWSPPSRQTSIFSTTPGNVGGGDPTGYAVYTSVDGRDYQFATTTANVTTYRLTGAARNATVFAYVTATNAGGESFPSNIAGARVQGAKPELLIVDGFTRIDYQLTPNQTIPAGHNISGNIARVIPKRINDYSYVIQHGNAVTGTGLGVNFDSATAASVKSGAVSLTGYKAVLWILGEESTRHETFDSTEQSLVTSFLNAGGCVFVSGSELAWDLDHSGTTGDKTFFNSSLRAIYAGDDAGTYAVVAAGGSIFTGNPILSFDQRNGPEYDAEYPDQLTPGTDATAALIYSGGAGGTAATTYTNSNGGKVVVLGFPFETITTDASRNEMMKDVLQYFALPTRTVNSNQWMVY